MKPYLLGIDIGTSACKIAIFDGDSGQVVAQDNQGYSVYYPQDNWAEQDSNEWWAAVCKGIKNCLDESGLKGSDIVGIGVDGQSWSAIPVDKSNEVLANTPIWFDTRSEKQVKDLQERIGDERVFQLNGNIFRSTHMTPKYKWFQEERPDIYQKTAHFLSSNAFIVMKLTDQVSSDYSQNYGVHFFDTTNMRYDNELTKEMGLNPNLFPPAFACHEIVGKVTEKAAIETGLASGIPVVAGGLDAATGTLGCGVLENGETQIQGGQAGGMSICEDEPRSAKELIISPHVVPGRWLLQGGTVGGGGVLRWLKESFLTDKSFNEITELAASSPVGSNGVLFFPYMAGERSPIWNPKAKGVYYGLSFERNKADMIRSSMEGVVLSVAHNFQIAYQLGIRVEELDIYAMGGMANSEFWMQIFCDVLDREIKIASSDTATNLGTIILAGVGIGLYDDFSVAKDFAKVQRKQEPNKENVRIYKDVLEEYLRISEGLQGLFR